MRTTDFPTSTNPSEFLTHSLVAGQNVNTRTPYEALVELLSLEVVNLTYLGGWNATSNSPAIPAASSSNAGHFRIVTTAGTTAIDGISSWAVGDQIISNGTVWEKIVGSALYAIKATETEVDALQTLTAGITEPDADSYDFKGHKITRRDDDLYLLNSDFSITGTFGGNEYEVLGIDSLTGTVRAILRPDYFYQSQENSYADPADVIARGARGDVTRVQESGDFIYYDTEIGTDV